MAKKDQGMPEIIESCTSWQRQEVPYLIHAARTRIRLARLRIGKGAVTDAEKVLLVGIQKNILKILGNRNT
ncbi:MAG: hypothetical protein HQL17_05475 [Candidatus Omnitrophica bacterium]|nr:hypothetical protein [Candidatus Omnitrophota bacterium]